MEPHRNDHSRPSPRFAVVITTPPSRAAFSSAERFYDAPLVTGISCSSSSSSAVSSRGADDRGADDAEDGADAEGSGRRLDRRRDNGRDDAASSSARDGGDGATQTLSLTLAWDAHNQFKQNDLAPGSYRVLDASGSSVLASGAFLFEPFWSATGLAATVAIEVPATVGAGDLALAGSIELRNAWDKTATAAFTCYA